MADSEMRPPPRRTNADFRKLLETPRADRFPSESQKPARAKKAQPEGAQASKPKPKKKPPKPEAEDGGEDDGPAYRDRAEERRKGINPDYERVSADLANIIGGPLNADMGGISVEDSKFLGGDVDHTHLVKGLDYALLQKVRGEMTKEEEQEKSAQDVRKSALEPEVVKFQSPAGRAVFNAVFARQRAATADAFAPGRTAFLFELEDAAAPDVPTTLRRSKADCLPAAETIRGGMDTSVLERMVKIMSYMRGTSGRPGKLRKKDKLRMLQMVEGVTGNGSGAKPKEQPPEQAAGPTDADADIFGEAGRDYAPELPQARAGAGAQASRPDVGVPPPPPPLPPPVGPAGPVGPARPSGGYDAAAAALAAYGGGDEDPQPPAQADEEDMELDQLAGLAPPPPPPAAAAEPRSRKERRAARAAERPGEAGPKEAIAKDGEDAYEELYPDYGGFGGAMVDSDEEDLTHMDARDKKSRYDFETEEQWEKHKAAREMLPKAAFQFGVKTSDGRRGKQQMGKAVEQKEAKQYKAIKNMLKQSHGDQYAAAFRQDRGGGKDGGGGGGPAKKRRI